MKKFKVKKEDVKKENEWKSNRSKGRKSKKEGKWWTRKEGLNRDITYKKENERKR